MAEAGSEHSQREFPWVNRSMWKCTETHLCSRTEDQEAGSWDLPRDSRDGKKTCPPRGEGGETSSQLRRTGVDSVKEKASLGYRVRSKAGLCY